MFRDGRGVRGTEEFIGTKRADLLAERGETEMRRLTRIMRGWRNIQANQMMLGELTDAMNSKCGESMIKSKREIAMNFSEARPASPPSRVSGARQLS